MPIFKDQNGNILYQLPTTQTRYPTNDFPPIIADAILEVSATLSMPVELAAHAALGVISLVCQDFINVQCPNFAPSSPALFLMALSNSSGGKSVLDLRFLRGFLAVERQRERERDAKLPFYRAELKLWHDDDHRLAKAYRKAEPDSEEARNLREERLRHELNRPVKPTVRELRFTDLSPQGLRDTLVANASVGIMSPEAWPTVNGMAFSQPAMLSGYWSGEDRPVGLAGGNRCPLEPRLTVAIMLQVNKFSDYMKNRGDDAFETGLLGRFLVVAPASDSLLVQETCIDDVPEPKLEVFNDRVIQLMNQVIPAPHERINLKTSDGANCLWKQFKDEINRQLSIGDYSENIKSFLRKLAQQASRIAALFHYFEGRPGEISPDSMMNAILLCDWYAHEYRRIFNPYAPSPQQKNVNAAEKLLDWLQTVAANPWRYPKLTVGRYTERDLSNYSAIRGDPAVLAKAIDFLYGQGCISIMYGKKNGRIICYSPAPMFSMPQRNYQAQQGNPTPGPWPNPQLYAGTNDLDSAMPSQQGFNSTVESWQVAGSQPQAENLKLGVNGGMEIRALRQELLESAKSAFDRGL